ncbi:SulP family inorganic anion transporter [Microbulbifer variabilis]|uniref:SulP family inorganic anion transporter n=1 Tax=Microbulbifer variabilis TaxID=266805 RepID=UPI001CFDF863|nr:SulP family inorganic anion transporter [Microbulbifer variabilis]
MPHAFVRPAIGTPTVADLKSGFLVFLIALPLCLGIAMASGFPAVAGILTAVVGGILSTFIGGAKLTIKGPAAGLIVIAIGAVMELGQGDMQLGYERTLAVGVVAAAIQIGFAFLRAATIGIVMSPSVVHGMLAAIGVIIIAKQAHVMLGVTPVAKEPLELLAEIPHSVMHGNPEIMLLGLLSLALMVILQRMRFAWLRALPAPIMVLLITVPLALALNLSQSHNYEFLHHTYEIGPDYLVQLPGSLLDVITFPEFSVVFSAASWKYVIMFALIGTIESILSVLAVDSMDPQRESSRLNSDLFATGIGNLLCAFIGGLPMISEIVRSKANVDAGAQTRWSNFFHGVFLLIFVAAAPALLSKIPLAVLAAMLVFTGARLASLQQLFHARKIGVDQLLLFSTTLVVTLATDLLTGVATGLVLKIVLHLLRGAPLRALFMPQVTATQEGKVRILKVHGAATFAAILPIRTQLGKAPQGCAEIVVNLSDTTLVDHTFLSRIEAIAQELPNLHVSIKGLDGLKALTQHPLATRLKVYP